MPFGSRSVSSPDYQGRRGHGRKVGRTPKATVTVTSDGKITAKGPDAKEAKRKARRSQRRVKAIVRRMPISTFRAETKDSGFSAGDVLDSIRDAGGDAANALHRTSPSGIELAKQYARNVKENADYIPLVPERGAVRAAVDTLMLASGGGAAGKVASLASDAPAARNAVTVAKNVLKEAPKRKAVKIKTAPKRAVRRIKETPKRIKTAPARAKKAATTKEGRRATAKSAARHPVRTGYGATAVSPVPLPGDADRRARALATGTAKAFVEEPLKTAGATGRGVIGMVAAPLALADAAVNSVATGSTKPLRHTAKEQFEGTVNLAGRLLSGDPKTVQKTVEEDVGLSYLAPIPAATRLKVYRNARGKLRAKAQDIRRTTAKKTGSRRMRVAPKGVESHVFRATENRAARKRVAKRVKRTTNPHRSQAAHHEREMLKHLRKAPVTRSLRNVHGMEAGDLIQTLAEYGIRSPEDVKFVREHGPVGETPKAGRVTLKTALDFAERHPEVLKDKHFSRALDAYIESTLALPAAKAGKGRRARAMAQGDMFGIVRPEERVPHTARPRTSAATRTGAWQEMIAREKRLKADRREAQALAAQAQVLTGKERQVARGKAEALYRKARAAEQENQALYKALRPFSRPGQALRPSARRKYYDEKLLREYEREVDAARSMAGLAEPVWTHHARFREAGDIGPRYPTAAAKVQHMREGTLAEHDLVDRSLRALMSGSVVGPRLRAGGQELARRFTEQEMLPVKIEGKTKHLITQEEWTKAVESGQYNPRHYVLFPARQFKQSFLDPFKTQAELAGEAGKALEKGLRETTPGNKYVVMRREAAKEFQAQISPEHWAGEKLVNTISKGASRWLLFSPAWVMIQSVAEAIPMAMAHPELLNPAKTVKLEASLRKSAKLTPDEAKAFAAVAGEAPRSLHTPNELRPELDSNPHGIFSDGARALTKNRVGQGLFSTARLRPFAVFDSWRQGKYRELLMAAEADKRMNSFYGALKGSLGLEKRISDELRGMPRHQQFAELTKPRYAKLMDELSDHVENIAGNWNTFTRYERSFAPFLVFYPFIRYSLRWPLTFAKQHPVAITIATFLSQQNAEQLEKILGRAPSNPLTYAIPVWQDGEGESHLLPTGQRAAPGLSAPTQAVASQQPSQALSVFNPLIGAAITGATGVNAYTGRQEPERGKQAADLLLATSPIARFFDIDSADITGLFGVDTSEPESALSRRFEQIDPERKGRSLYKPWEGLSPRAFREGENLGRDVTLKYSDPVPSLWDNPEIGEAIFGRGNGRVDWKLLRRLLSQHKAAQAASERVRAQERQFFEEQSGGDLSDAQLKALKMLQDGRIMITPKESATAKLDRQLGIPSTPSKEDLDKMLGIPSIPDTAALDKRLGIR